MKKAKGNSKYSTLNMDHFRSRVPKGSILEPLFSLIYINNISDNLVSNPKLVSEGTSLFLVIQDRFPSKIPIRRFEYDK